MQYLFILLASFIVILFITQLIFFEITRKKMKERNNIDWFLSLDKPFNYNRVGYMAFLCFFCYIITSPENFLSLSWIVYFVLFLAMGIVSDAVVQYLIILYGKKRCHNEIEELKYLKNELANISQSMSSELEYEESPRQYNEKEILSRYIDATDHMAFLSADGGEFASTYSPLPEAAFIVEPYTNHSHLESKFADSPIKVTDLTPSKQMPFKDEKMDIVMCQYSNYDKYEIYRILKSGGYFIVNQNGTTNYKEFLDFYMPFRIKGSWDAYACAGSLEEAGMKIIEKYDDYGTIRFHSIQSLHNFFKKVSPDIADIHKFQTFYMNALREIHQKNFYEITTHRFLVVAKKI